ncbi:cytochrome P450 monooxygenase-like protein [Aulographum hederae CBS 113979]|uniref:Cytochrome P450 monooxygenase-like protein n=1 Tax=Aulographum hederae CBS 113979 TaxID=1176131 RepID=A0A6G1GPR4_9PEZI|nr:cytochrome P450 monooxygenase-like protein [Aulographum hederae CBS 113979]
MLFILAVVAPLLFVFLTSVLPFAKNYIAAKKTGLPLLYSPTSHFNPLWIILQQPLRPLLLKLPFGIGQFARHSTLDWFFIDKYKLHDERGQVLLKVTPGMMELHVADPAVNHQIYARKKDFEKPKWILDSAKIYGHAVSSVTGSDWQRHRRITAPPFNERNSALVWHESIKQTEQMIDYWNEQGNFNTVWDDCMTLSLNVLATAAFGKVWHFRSAKDEPQPGYTMNYRDCLALLMSSIELIVLTPKWLYKHGDLPFLPKALKDYLLAYNENERYMMSMIKEKKEEFAAGNVELSEANFLNTLIKKSEEARQQAKAADSPTLSLAGLSEDEIMGNLFTFSFAGHETTAHTMAFAIFLLGVYPEWQTWIGEEIDAVFAADKSGEDYSTLFPQLKRVLALMYETLRLYAPVHSVNKSTIGPAGQDLTINGRTVRIPPNTLVAPNVMASHTLPAHWGPDHMVFRPARWIQPLSTPVSEKLDATNANTPAAPQPRAPETMLPPPGGVETFIAWSDGARVCPGKKFSQVEFVAVMATVFRKWRIEVVRKGGESAEMARERALEIVKDSQTAVTLTIKRPQEVAFRLVGR